ncbi:ABC transporter substrate-binding protein [Synechococcales cyanobacterium C]|uniref:ABC transporter substrate-binding protein n=1 Tax=Petrachloros mirabilis ULC683 TaxID=2781853 RepID=A0A8K1ZYM3_9CYAN|nr:iron-siderophore ABC transporter substrate-binding protein [Petrachloros mirabilis]NCJ07710.1 ABC transporter substrate-binding protein [Petrachloros mirabilis ULC683]
MQLKFFWQKIHSLFLLILILGLIITCQHKTLEKSAPSARYSTTEDCRTISHSMGETCVPNEPQKVVVLTHLDNTLTLGIKPIGASTKNDNKFSSLLIEQTKEIENVGLLGEPSLEKLVQLNPDLIVLAYPRQIYTQLSEIAPTVLFWDQDEAYENWKDIFNAYANVLGKTKEANEILNDYQQRVIDFRNAMGDRLSNTEVSIVNFFANDVRLYLKQSFAGQILEEVGLPRPPEQDKDEWSVEHLSLEAIPQMAGDVIFLTLGGHEQSKLDQFTSHPLWSQLEAVQKGRVYEVSSRVWIGGETPVAANLVLDDLFKYLISDSQ